MKEMSHEERNRLAIYFSNAGEKRIVPRAIIVDLESGTVETIKNSALGELFSPYSYLNEQNGAGNNFAKGFYTEGANLIDAAMELISKEVEKCECLQAFQVSHSSGGGTGSGLGSRIITSLRDEYSEKIVSTLSVFPSEKVSDVVVEPYNASLTLNHLIESASSTIFLDNEALYNICFNTLKISQPSYEHLNSLISEAICGLTACVRFPGQLNTDIRKLSVNLTPFPRMHFFITSTAPLSGVGVEQYRALNIADITTQMLEDRNMMADCSPSSGKYFAIATIFRGKFSTREMDEKMVEIRRKYEKNFVEWIPNNILTAATATPPIESLVSGTFVGNTTSITKLYDRIQESCNKMLKRNAFVHWYTEEGMEISEITEALNSIGDLSEEYKNRDQ